MWNKIKEFVGWYCTSRVEIERWFYHLLVINLFIDVYFIIMKWIGS